MIASGSRQTIFANLIQQACAAALLLSLPNLLDKQEYAQTVFVGILLGFMALADFGLLLVYGRLVPALVTKGNALAIVRWDASVSVFGLLASIFFSLMIALIYWLKFRHGENAAMLSLLPIGLYWISFHISRTMAAGDFSEYQRAIGIRALASLLAIPMVAAAGLSAWFASQVVAALLVMGLIGRRLLEPIGRVDWVLVRSHIPEGLMLCVITAAWLQLLNFGRLYASLVYPAETVAHYGIMGAAYQSLSTLLISAFVPVSVGVLGRFGKSNSEALEFMRTVLARSVWWVLSGSILMTEAAPHALGFFFPDYRFEGNTLLALLLGLVFYPFFLLLGNCMVAKQKAGTYLLLISVALGVCLLVAGLIDLFFQGQGAAWGQLIGLVIFTCSLYLTARSLFGGRPHETWRYLGRCLMGVGFSAFLYAGLRMGLK